LYLVAALVAEVETNANDLQYSLRDKLNLKIY